MAWETTDRCPICKAPFKSDKCPHSYPQVQKRLEDDHIRALIRQELKDRKDRK